MPEVFVKTLIGRTLTIPVEMDDTIEHVKSMITDLEGIPADEQRLILGGRELQDGDIVGDYRVMLETTLFLALRPKPPTPEEIAQAEARQQEAEALQREKEIAEEAARQKWQLTFGPYLKFAEAVESGDTKQMADMLDNGEVELQHATACNHLVTHQQDFACNDGCTFVTLDLAKGASFLHVAALFDQKEAARMLLQRGLSPDIANGDIERREQHAYDHGMSSPDMRVTGSENPVPVRDQ